MEISACQNLNMFSWAFKFDLIFEKFSNARRDPLILQQQLKSKYKSIHRKGIIRFVNWTSQETELFIYRLPISFCQYKCFKWGRREKGKVKRGEAVLFLTRADKDEERELKNEGKLDFLPWQIANLSSFSPNYICMHHTCKKF